MSINLKKGQRISLTKAAPGLSQILCGLGWDLATKVEGRFLRKPSQDFDLDSAVLCIQPTGKLADIRDVVYYSNLQHHSGAIIHHGDNLTGAGSGDDEQVWVDLNQLPAAIHKLVFVVTIYEALRRQQTFGQVENAFVRLVNTSNSQEIARYNLSGQNYTEATAMVMAEVYRTHDEWQMAAIGEAFKVAGLSEILKYYT